MSKTLRLLPALALVAAVAYIQAQQESQAERFRRMSLDAETRGLAEPYRGITTGGTIQPGLFPIHATGVSTQPVQKAATAFLAALSPQQRDRTKFAVDDIEWRKWMNQDFYLRQGVSFKEMSDAQREAAFGLMRASLSAKGLKLSQDIMKLNYTLGELNNNDFVRYGEWAYWITMMGDPSSDKPWGWQIDGHHLVINYFVLRDQVVMTPLFLGSEPTVATSGKYQGTAVLQDEQRMGLKMIQGLSEPLRKKAILESTKTHDYNVGEAFKDNIVLDYAGVRVSEFSAAQKEQLTGLIGEYVRNMDDGHARVKMEEVRRHLDATWFAWIGGTEEQSVYYYRIQSPVLLIEFDHQLPVGLRHLVANPNLPYHEHIHTVVRTPNGNDYGKDLLRQHYLLFPH
jgi:Protein of unknown function (DUF3500)